MPGARTSRPLFAAAQVFALRAQMRTSRPRSQLSVARWCLSFYKARQNTGAQITKIQDSGRLLLTSSSWFYLLCVICVIWG
jgi:hypothetical protein